MILSGDEIKKRIELGDIIIEPYNPKNMGPNSYDLCIADELMVYDESILDMKKKNKTKKITIPEEGYVLEPGKLYLGRTVEYTKTNKYAPMLEGRSSIGRLGVFIHATAGFGDVGFAGTWTLELSCVQPVLIYPNSRICQIYYHTIDGNINNLYGDSYKCKYYEQKDITSSASYKDFSN